MMKVAMYYGAGDIRLEEMPIPKVGANEILVRVVASGICGSDVMHWYRAGKQSRVLGHEIAGEIVEVGEDVKQYKIGDRIAVSHHVPCNTCHYCLNGHHTVCELLQTTNFYPGGFSEYVKLLPIHVDRGIYIIPDEVTFEEGTFAEPLACVYRGQRIAGVNIGHSVLVIGSGISGVLHIQLAKALGAGFVAATDISPYRIQAAQQLGADAVFNATDNVPERLKEANSGRLANIVILTSGAESAIEQAFQSVDKGGTILFFAPTRLDAKINLPVNDLFWRKEITLTSSYAANYEEHMTAMELIRQKRVHVGDMITHRLPLAETPQGFQLVEDANESLKVIVTG